MLAERGLPYAGRPAKAGRDKTTARAVPALAREFIASDYFLPQACFHSISTAPPDGMGLNL